MSIHYQWLDGTMAEIAIDNVTEANFAAVAGSIQLV
jgi:hypothetical protein